MNGLRKLVGNKTSDNPTDYGCIMLFQIPNTKINIQNITKMKIMKKIIGFNFSEFDPIFKYSQKLVYILITNWRERNISN